MAGYQWLVATVDLTFFQIGLIDYWCWSSTRSLRLLLT
uniref:Uncharacterized protein n=1 Tax=Anguilla anguilla TaxID=7936 RepID=A0A0E9P7B1_ANGAN